LKREDERGDWERETGQGERNNEGENKKKQETALKKEDDDNGSQI
jgi:hypothetical protein